MAQEENCYQNCIFEHLNVPVEFGLNLLSLSTEREENK